MKDSSIIALNPTVIEMEDSYSIKGFVALTRNKNTGISCI